MTTSTTTAEADAYLEAVRVELDDLPEEERTDLLEDLAEHLADMEAERTSDEPPLTTLLGPPERYAAELRAAADLPPRTEREPVKDSFRTRLGRSGPARLVKWALRLPASVKVREFLPELRPAWWVLRGYLLIAIPSLWSPNGQDDFPIPTVGGSDFLGFWFTLAAIVGSVWLGRRQLGKRQRKLVILGNALLLILSLTLIESIDERVSPDQVFAVSGSGTAFRLMSPSGPITNIYPYASDGTPLDGVLLFDQDGRPLRTDAQMWWPDGCKRLPAFPRAADGVGVEFSYPKDYVLIGSQLGQPCSPEIARPQVPIPTFGGAGTTATQQPGATESPAPAGASPAAEGSAPAAGAEGTQTAPAADGTQPAAPAGTDPGAPAATDGPVPPG